MHQVIALRINVQTSWAIKAACLSDILKRPAVVASLINAQTSPAINRNFQLVILKMLAVVASQTNVQTLTVTKQVSLPGIIKLAASVM
jgi:hypothetical protein